MFMTAVCCSNEKCRPTQRRWCFKCVKINNEMDTHRKHVNDFICYLILEKRNVKT